MRISTPYREWDFSGTITRVPEFCAPGLGNRANKVLIDADIPADANGVLYALGGAGGGLTCYVEDGYLCYEYNTFIVMRTTLRSPTRLPTGPAKIQIETAYAEPRPAGPLDITMTVNDAPFGAGRVPVSVPLAFTANDCLDIGTCLGSPVSTAYYDKAPFPFTGQIHNVNVRYTT